jgi:single-strand DNA-binding protein
MSYDVNVFTATGRLSSDPDLRYLPDGTPTVKFGLAVGGGKKSNGDDIVSFFNVTAWRKLAESVANYIKKGAFVTLTGHLQQRSWTNEKGEKRSMIEVVADRIVFPPKPKDGSSTTYQDNNSKAKSHEEPKEAVPVDSDGAYNGGDFPMGGDDPFENPQEPNY